MRSYIFLSSVLLLGGQLSVSAHSMSRRALDSPAIHLAKRTNPPTTPEKIVIGGAPPTPGTPQAQPPPRMPPLSPNSPLTTLPLAPPRGLVAPLQIPNSQAVAASSAALVRSASREPKLTAAELEKEAAMYAATTPPLDPSLPLFDTEGMEGTYVKEEVTLPQPAPKVGTQVGGSPTRVGTGLGSPTRVGTGLGSPTRLGPPMGVEALSRSGTGSVKAGSSAAKTRKGQPGAAGQPQQF